MKRNSAQFRTTTLAVALLAASALLSAQTSAAGPAAAAKPTSLDIDQQAFCNYVTEQAAAQRDLLRTPSVVAGVTQPNTGLPLQAVWGLSSSLSNLRKAGLTMDAAGKNCDLYAASTSAQQKIQYGAASLEKNALYHRLDLILTASGKLDEAIAATSKMVDSQNATRPMLFALENTKIKLEGDKAETQSKIAAMYVPELSPDPLRELLALEKSSQTSEEQALDKLNRQNNWDVAVSIGAHQQLNPVESTGAYGEVTISYNLGSRAIDKHLDQAANAYVGWKNVQENDLVRSAEVLRLQIADAISVQTSRLKSLQEQQKQIEDNLKLVATADTSAALDFNNQLTSAQLLLAIEMGDADFRRAELEQFQRDNY
jgi:hypothetical protein